MNERSPAQPGAAFLAYRGAAIATTALAYLASSLAVGAVVAARHGRIAGRRHLDRSAVHLLQRLGPTFVKFGQIASTRRDALPAALCAELSVLHDAVAPMSAADVRRALSAAYGTGPDALFRYEQLSLVASGSIAGVFRAPWHDGTEVALKLQRPGIARLMRADLALMVGCARLAQRLPKCRGMPLGELTRYVSAAILGQLDFAREAASLDRIHERLGGVPGVRVPALVGAACRPNCVVMEFVPGLDTANVHAHGAQARKQLALTALFAATKLIFLDGFVHCDLHPGNLYVTRAGEVVILDAGFSVQLPDRVRRLIAEFFVVLAAGNGRRCGEIIVESAAAIRAGTELAGFVAAVEALVAAQTGQFAMMTFGNALFDLQQRFGLYAESDFVFPLMSLAVIESTVRALSPELDFRELGRTLTAG